MSSSSISDSPRIGFFRDRQVLVFAVIFTGLVSTALVLVWVATRSPWEAPPAVGVTPLALPVPLPVVPKPVPLAPGADGRVVPTGEGGVNIVPELVEQSLELNAEDSSIQRDFEVLDTLVEFYRHFHHGENPLGGENDEIVAQLTGRNLSKLAVLHPDHPAIDGQGRLLDRWGTPFYFHPVSHEVLEMRSAGPDGRLWTPDDVQYEPHW